MSANARFENTADHKDPAFGRVGTLITRLARTPAEIRAAQALRYNVFYHELGARPSLSSRLLRRDMDRFDRYCHHLLVIDQTEHGDKIVGTYRLMVPEQHVQAGAYYSQNEFDLAPLLQANANARMMELGRSCILPDYRSKRTMELLWHGTWAFAVHHRIDILFGCASFPGIDQTRHAQVLGWLCETAKLADDEDCHAIGPDSVTIPPLEEEASQRRMIGQLPPLLKGYLKLGAKVAGSAILDRQFNTTDVLVVLKVADISPRYLAHYGQNATRFAV